MQQKVFINLPASQTGVANQAEPWEGRWVLWVGGQGASRAQEGSGQEMAKIFVSCCVCESVPSGFIQCTRWKLEQDGIHSLCHQWRWCHPAVPAGFTHLTALLVLTHQQGFTESCTAPPKPMKPKVALKHDLLSASKELANLILQIEGKPRC